MDQRTVNDWKHRISVERNRSMPPDDFPQLPDIPAGRYIDPGFYRLERQHLWQRSWLYAAHVDQIPNAGDFVLWRHGSAPIVIMRDDDGQINAFYNTCRHRGAPVLRSDTGNAPRRMVCGYHGWSYDRRGQLQSISEARDWHRVQHECKDLIRVACESYGNWIFVNEDPAPRSLASFLAPVTRYIDHLPLDSLRLVDRQTLEVAANVKVLLENFLEAYHFNLLHADTTHRIFDNRGTSIHLWEHGHSMMLSPNRRANWVDPGVVGMPEMAEATAIERDHNPSYCLFPNLILPIAPSGIPGVAMWPKSIDRSIIEVLWFAPDPIDQPRDPLWKTRIANFARIVSEDIQLAEPLQETLNSRGFTGVPLSYQERRIYHWHVAADKAIGVDRIPENLRVADLLQHFVE